NAAFAGRIERNVLSGGAVGLAYNAPATVSGNRIHHNMTGVTSSVAGDVNGLGFVGVGDPNEIIQNTTGVQLTGQMQNQRVRYNATGVSGSGMLGGNLMEFANLIEGNTVGVDFAGSIQYNRVGRNGTAIVARSSQLIAHNVLYRNEGIAVRVSGATDVRIV